MPYVKSPDYIAETKDPSGSMPVPRPLGEQLQLCNEAVLRLCKETSQLLQFVCCREVEPCQLDGRELSAHLAWLFNTIGKCLDALSDINQLIR